MITLALLTVLLAQPQAPFPPDALAQLDGAFGAPLPPLPPVPPVPPLPRGGDALEAKLFPPELVMDHQKDLGLDAKQRNAIADEVARAQGDIVRSQFKLRAATEELSELLDALSLDEKKVLAKADEVMDQEREVKRANLAMLVRVKNLLSAEQRKKMEEIREMEGPREVRKIKKVMEAYRAGLGEGNDRKEGRLVVVAPVESTIEIDGKDAGRSPVVLDLPPGNHKVTITAPDGKRETRAIVVEPGSTSKIVIE